MQHLKKPLLYLAFTACLFTACDTNEQDVAPTDDNEAITTATLQLTNKTNTAEVVTATVDNLTTTPNFSNAVLTLRPNTAYSARILLSDKTKTPTVDVSADIKDEQNEHLFIYTPATGLNLTAVITDKDTNPAPGPYPLGLTADMTTGASSAGKLNVVLRHQPNAKNGTATPGTVDLDTSFDVIIR
ncbi:MAG: hypothetical protein H7Z72_24835 [Bacteroidetes bacterium]|nr:hypothetical protein [Fibrella sp.]